MSNPKWFKYEWIWEKNLFSNPFNSKNQPLRAHETILIFSEKKQTYNPQFRAYSETTKKRYSKGGSPKGGKNGTNSVYRDMKQNRNDLNMNRGAYPISICKINAVHNGNFNRLHPTQKPVALIEYLIKTYTLKGELILDNTAGSGTLAIAAINTDRNYICIEKDEHYFEVMRDRIENHDPNAIKPQPKLPKKKPVNSEYIQLSLFNDCLDSL